MDNIKSGMSAFVLSCCLLQVLAQTCKDGNRVYTGVTDEDKRTILEDHNRFRNKMAAGEVDSFPSAANIKKMVWSEVLEDAAQAHANECRMEHFEPEPEKYGSNYGQNLYKSWSTGKIGPANWTAAIDSWFSEYSLFPLVKISPFKFVPLAGHFTQVVWAESFSVGCGYAEYTDDSFNNALYTCNYLPTGNVESPDNSVFTQMYSIGKPCSNCTCDSTYNNLCA